MQPGDFCYYIDTKGNQHKAQVVMVRPNKVLKANGGLSDLGTIVNDEPIVSLSYVNPRLGKSEIVPELMHISHPAKQETHEGLPTIHLYAWKRLDEAHTTAPEDHPIHDHPHERPGTDTVGNIIPKARPKWEAMIADHRATLHQDTQAALAEGERLQAAAVESHVASDPVFRLPQDQGKTAPVPAAPVEKVAEEPKQHHPGNPETIHFDFSCPSCGKGVKRVASHQGGKLFDSFPIGEGGLGWSEHVCMPADLTAHHAKVAKAAEPPKPEMSPSERLAIGEKIAPEPEAAVPVTEESAPEPGVIAQLEEDVKKQPPIEAQGDEQK